MARHAIPSEITIRVKLEQLPLFCLSTPAIGDKPPQKLAAARIDGEAEISYEPLSCDITNWHVSDVWVDVENGRMGDECRWLSHNLNADTDEWFYRAVLEAIEENLSSYIEDRIMEEIGFAYDYRPAA